MNLKCTLALLTTSFAALTASAEPVDLVLHLKERTPIEALVKNVNDPKSSHYRKFYTPAEILKLSGPTRKQYDKVLSDLREKGFEITGETKTHLFISIRGEQKSVESLFSTQMKPKVRNRWVGVLTRVLFPKALDIVETVTGLDQTRVLHPHYHLLPKNGVNAMGDQTATPPPALTPQQVRTAYGFDSIYDGNIDGTGQHIAIATYGGFHMDDVNGFFKEAGLSPAPAIDQVTFNGTAEVDEDAAVETALDTEFAGMLAPGAKVHVFTSSQNNSAGEMQMFTAILDDNRARVVNYSWGICETAVDPAHRADMDKIFAQAVAQGVNILVASGDAGAYGCSDGSVNKVADWPSSSPNVVAVGGTKVKLNSYGDISTETAWNWEKTDPSGSGGGISSFYALPDYQSFFKAPYLMRSAPDVSFDADPESGQQVWTSCQPNKQGTCEHGTAGWMSIGGTSMAAPQWAGFMALVEQARANQRLSPLGQLNPIIYALDAKTRSTVFHDVTSGTNGGYKASKGWDPVTGWGSMRADSMLNYLGDH